MTKEQRENIKKDIERILTHIARTNGVMVNDVKSILIDDYVDMDDYVVIQWPEIQEFMELKDFHENACLVNDDFFVDMYGSSAYFVNKKWLNEL